MSGVVLGIDPGATATGFAILDERHRRRCPWSITVTRPDGPLLPVPKSYLDDVVATAVTAASTELGFRYDVPEGPVELVAIEGIKRPEWRVRGKVKPLDPTAILATAIVFGALYGRAWPMPIAVVPPGRNGSAPFGVYPPELVSDAERRPGDWQLRAAGKGKLAHERSAWDVALDGRQWLTIGQTRKATR